MKFEIRIFVDGYETMVDLLKQTELKPISDAIFEYLQNQKLQCELEMKRYNQPVVLRASEDFMMLNEKRISLNPFGFHKKLEIQFDYLNNDNYVCNCFEVWCEGSCGCLDCGCIDVCRGRCGMNNYDSY
jgi:hypothetical protein